MKYALSLVALLAIGCGQGAEIPDTGTSGIDLTALDRSVDPCTDFYKFACGSWIAQHPINSDGGGAAKFYEPYYATIKPLREIIEADAAGARAADDPFATLIGTYYSSCNSGVLDLTGRDTIRALLAKVDAVKTLDDLARRVAAQREIGSGSFFYFYVGVDPGDATRNTTAISQGGIELADPSYYLDPQNKDILTAYRAHITAMSALIGGTPIDADAVIRVETALVTAYTPDDQLRDPESTHHPMSPEEVIALAPTFPWQAFWAEAGFTGLKSVNVNMPTYLTALEALLKAAPLEDLKSYVRWQLLQDRSSGLDKAFIEEDFLFSSTFTGETAPSPRWFTCFNDTLRAFGEAVAKPYLARNYDELSTAFTKGMFERSRDAFSKRLGNASWLDGPTRKEAVAKLEAIVPKVGHPDGDPDFTGLVITPASFLGNELALRRFRSERERARLGQKVDRTEWNLSPLTVNASYSPSANDVTLPAALLASPFFVITWSNAANFGALGGILGHEMTHGFDDQGRHFDGNGTLRNWWTPAVEKSFAARAACVVDQFDAFEPLPGEHVDGTLTLGENIADLGGVSIAFDALFDGNDDEAESDGFKAKQVFFLAYAQTHCESLRPEVQSQSLLTDPHSPGRDRVNGPLSNLPTFREAFACPAGAPMVRPEACEVW
jgi:endothelin-converting enzyme/putative endopeptidase